MPQACNASTEAENYASEIASELEALDALLSGATEGALWTTSGVDRPDDPTDTSLVLHTYLNEVCLEVEVLRASNNSQRNRVEITRTVGGPGCYIVRDNRDGEVIGITVYWGGETATRSLHLPLLSAMLDELAECC